MKKFFRKNIIPDNKSMNKKEKNCVVQELNRHNYVTPTSYLELLSSYGNLLEKKKMELMSAAHRLTTGNEN